MNIWFFTYNCYAVKSKSIVFSTFYNELLFAKVSKVVACDIISHWKYKYINKSHKRMIFKLDDYLN